MRLTVFILLITILSSQSYAQKIVIRGIVKDNKSEEPLPYAHIFNKNQFIGTISNKDGMFRLECSKKDTLRISYIGYETKFIPCSYFLANSTCFLEPSSNELRTVEIVSTPDFILDLFMEAQKKMKIGSQAKSKTYFTLKSTSNNSPVELLECYYNSTVMPSGFNNLELKNGRVGVAEIDNNYFVSLSTIKIVSDYNLLIKVGNIFPMNPLQLSKSRIKNVYKYDILELKNGIYKVEFKPKNERESFFNTIVYLDMDKRQLVKIELSVFQLNDHPFSEINEEDQMGELDYTVSYTFDNTARNLLEKIGFKYSFRYDNNVTKKQIETEGIFLFYDKSELFSIPYYSEPESIVTDYDKIISQPYDKLFWRENVVLLPSKESIKLRNFFNENGVLLNFNSLSENNSLFKDKVIPWSKRRIFPYEINWKSITNNNVVSNPGGLKTRSKLYNFSVQIYLDRNAIKDSVYYIAETLIDIDKSYCHLKKANNTSCFLNLYFDQVEIIKEEMLKTLRNQEWEKDQVDSIFNHTQLILKKELKAYGLLSNHGKNEKILSFYADKVEKRLKVDNTLLLADQQLKDELNQIHREDRKAHIELYKFGNKLFKLEQYDNALTIFTKALELGDDNTWLYYNIGLTYSKLGDKTNACFLFEKCIELGKTIDPEVLQNCDN